MWDLLAGTTVKSDMIPNGHFSVLAPVYDLLGGLINRGDLVHLLNPSPGDRVLDVGGGTGLLRDAFDGVPLSSWTVLDLNRRMLSMGRRHGRSCLFVQGSSYQLPFPAGQFDQLLIADALHHMGRPLRVLSEARRVLRPGGRLVVEEFDPDTPIGRLTEAGEWLAGMQSQFLRPDRLITVVRDAGLTVERRCRRRYLYYVVASAGDGEC